MQVFDPNHKPRPSMEAVKVEKDPCPCSHDWDVPQGCQLLGSRGRAGWDSDPHCSPPACGVCLGKLSELDYQI